MPFSENRVGTLLLMTSSTIDTPHAFTTRFGGVSSGIYDSLNLGLNLGDDPNSVRRNYEILGSALGFASDRLVMSHQVHGSSIRVVTKADMQSPFEPIPYEADGLITEEENVPLVIFTADCVPILLYDPVGCAIGAIHAGWRGSVRDIAGKAVHLMARRFGSRTSDIRAVIGPCISVCCFETGDDVKDEVRLALGPEASAFITSHGEKYMVDLKGLNSLLLKKAGIQSENIEISPECTSCLSDKYWSHRVTKGHRGSQASVIMLKGRIN